jgi:murein DD-endopeptidase MepM/ murein hydrolase activator NlpD
VHFIITDAWLAKSRAIHLSGTKLVMALAVLCVALMLTAAGLYHWVFLKGAREGWPVVGAAARLVTKDDFDQRDRFLRENLDAMARRLGEMQAKLVQLESLGERVSGLAGVKVPDLRSAAAQGGALIAGRPLSLQELQAAMDELDRVTGQHTDLLTVIESRLIEQKMSTLMLPTRLPVPSGHLGSPFGWRIDPFTGRNALHSGLDYEAQTGAPVVAAAGGVVVAQEVQPAYGNVVEIDHGNDLVTRYAHLSRFSIRKGDLVKRGQKIAEVGTTGRSTGPHLHFEVLVRGVPQNPQKFLAAARDPAALQLAQDGARHRRSRAGTEPATPR